MLPVVPSLRPSTRAQAPARGAAPAISAAFPYESKYVEVLGSRLHYVDEGQGDPMLFIHGNPTSSYLWRNVIPYVTGESRAIAIDLIGMGKSGKPDIDYKYQDHKRYVDAFIDALGLRNLTFVIHDWGTVLGFDYARHHEGNVVGIAFMEALVPPRLPNPNAPAPNSVFGRFRTPGVGEKMILEDNYFVETMLPGGVIRTLSQEEMDYYRAPYPTPASRKPTLMWPRELPMGGEPARNVEVVTAVGEWMKMTEIPMLHLWGRSGPGNPDGIASEMVKRVRNIQSTFVGMARHYLQEDQPETIGRALADWRRRVRTGRAAVVAPRGSHDAAV
ncbi:MAG: haloalkane dehalogenase [Acidobacteria bacterium]|nr:haloalkane dehalogenase [Acidobacteriota bacterium]